MQSFNNFFNARKKQISEICSELDKKTNYRIEYDDLFQEASLKLFELYKNKRPLDINYSLKAIKNHLLDYIKLCKKDILYDAVSLEEINIDNEDLDNKVELN